MCFVSEPTLFYDSGINSDLLCLPFTEDLLERDVIHLILYVQDECCVIVVLTEVGLEAFVVYHINRMWVLQINRGCWSRLKG